MFGARESWPVGECGSRAAACAGSMHCTYTVISIAWMYEWTLPNKDVQMYMPV